MIEGALLTVNVIMMLFFIVLALWSWIKRNDMQSFSMFVVIAITYILNIMYIVS